MPIESPFRCTHGKCQHVVKYDFDSNSHCPGCGFSLREMHLNKETDAFDYNKHCYACWLKSPIGCEWEPFGNREEREKSDDGNLEFIVFGIEIFRCPSCSGVYETDRVEVRREPDSETREFYENHAKEWAKQQAKKHEEDLRAQRRSSGCLKIFGCLMLAALCLGVYVCGRSHPGPSQDSSEPTSIVGKTLELSTSELKGKSALELDHMRNEIYARHGFTFGKRRPDLISYFRAQEWYHPDCDDQSIVERRFSNTEKHNVALISNFQKSHGLVYKPQ